MDPSGIGEPPEPALETALIKKYTFPGNGLRKEQGVNAW
jgi:hypothetical protein